MSKRMTEAWAAVIPLPDGDWVLPFKSRKDAETQARKYSEAHVVELVPATDLRALKRVEKAAKASVINHALCASYVKHRCVLCRALAALRGER